MQDVNFKIKFVEGGGVILGALRVLNTDNLYIDTGLYLFRAKKKNPYYRYTNMEHHLKFSILSLCFIMSFCSLMLEFILVKRYGSKRKFDYILRYRSYVVNINSLLKGENKKGEEDKMKIIPLHKQTLR